VRVGRDRWNHNIHYGLQALGHVPDTAGRALDVGCGEGWMARELRRLVPHVVGLDTDRPSLIEARSHEAASGLDYVLGDLLACPFADSSFDLVTCIAALHHTDEEVGLRRLAVLLRPGGTLVVIGLARSQLPKDVPWEVAGAVATRAHKLTKRGWDTPAPKIWPPPHTYDQIKGLAETVLPGATFRRRALWRYVLTWTKPTY
jgi:2-polyprenyl-3-methyl-5-hydroxy-6-metoxy-1,4-benzoquinol methylase